MESRQDRYYGEVDVRETGQSVAYIMSRFPKLTETFILFEMLEVRRQGIGIEIFPLLKTNERVAHPASAELLPNVHFEPLVSMSIVLANARFLLRRPGRYLGALCECLAGTAGSLNFFVGALGIFAKTVRMAETITDLGIAHVHAHFSSHPGLAALIIHRLTGIPFSMSTHGHDIHIDLTMFRAKALASSFTVVISEYNRQFLIERMGTWIDDKLRLVRCGVDTVAFGPKGEAAPRSGMTFEMLCVASFKEVKGHRYLLEASALLKQQGVDFALHLVGDGPLEGELRRCADRLGLTGRVWWDGALPGHEVARRMRAADVVILPSILASRGDREGIPVALMEAMACGVPVVASRLSGIPELVEDGVSGFLVEPKDVVGMAEVLGRLAKEPGIREGIGKAGRAKVEREYTIARNAARLAELFETEGGKPRAVP